jgi:hypothetical protein
LPGDPPATVPDSPAGLWTELQRRHPAATARVAAQFGPRDETTQQFLDRLQALRMGASIADARCGTPGNPYEQAAEDLGLLMAVAEKLTGLEGRFPGG